MSVCNKIYTKIIGSNFSVFQMVLVMTPFKELSLMILDQQLVI